MSNQQTGLPGCSSISMGGEYGRRVSITIANNLLQLDIEKDFLAPLREKTGAFTGVGALLNAASLLACADIDGALVGGASLNAVDFTGIVRAASKQSQ